MKGAPSSRGLIDCVPFQPPQMFEGTVEQRVKDVLMFLVASELRNLTSRPFVDAIERLELLQPFIDEIRPDALELGLQLRRPS